MGRESAFVRGFEKQAAKEPILKRLKNYLRNPIEGERKLKKSNKYRLSRLALGLGVPAVAGGYLTHKALSNKGYVHPQKMKPTPEYY